jgi:hypothetical protein
MVSDLFRKHSSHQDELSDISSYYTGQSSYSQISDYHHRMIVATKALNRPGCKGMSQRQLTCYALV